MVGSFFQQVYDAVRQIPQGNVATYGLIAKLIGTRDARRVGHALHANTDHADTPCHRVVFADGSLASGYVFGGPQKQRERLEQEGITFLKNGHVKLVAHVWDPRL